MTIDEYCENCGKSARQKFEEQSERDKELMRNAFNFGRRSVIMEIMDCFDICCTYDKYENFEDYYFACYGTLEKLLEQAYNEGKNEGKYSGEVLRR